MVDELSGVQIIWSEIILAIANQTRTAHLFNFEITQHDFGPNCTPVSSISSNNRMVHTVA